jgi:hypothetical protein
VQTVSEALSDDQGAMNVGPAIVLKWIFSTVPISALCSVVT